MVHSADSQLTEDEAKLYDRQIRLWGVEAQKSLRNANVLLVGMCGCGAEIAKNVMLSGVAKLTVVDSRNVTNSLRQSNFMIDAEQNDIVNVAESCRRSLQALNPNVTLVISTDYVSTLIEKGVVEEHSIVVIVEGEAQLAPHCREVGKPYICASVFGLYGCTFTDLGDEYKYIGETKVTPAAVEDEEGADGTVAMVIEESTAVNWQTMKFVPLDSAMTVVTKEAIANAEKVKPRRRKIPQSLYIVIALKHYCKTHGAPSSMEELDMDLLIRIWREVIKRVGLEDADLDPPSADWAMCGQLQSACAVVGGIVVQELIKAVTGKDKPYDNTFVYSGVENSGTVCRLPSNSV